MVPQYVKNWPDWIEVIFGRELNFSRESKTTFQGQMRTENQDQDHFRAILWFHLHRYHRQGWHAECWSLSGDPSATCLPWKTTGWKWQRLTPNICFLSTTTTFLFPPSELLFSEWTDNQLQDEPAHPMELKGRPGSMAASGSYSCWSDLTKRSSLWWRRNSSEWVCCQV